MNVKYLKIKLKSLAEEARIIRHEEKKLGGQNWGSSSVPLREHRIHVVRVAARRTLLAYGYLRGKKYNQLEQCTRTPFEYMGVKEITKMVQKYGSPKTTEEDIKNWLLESHTIIEGKPIKPLNAA